MRNKICRSSHADERDKRVSATDHDDCVMCGTHTEYRVTDHIDMRQGYVEGCGQLCIGCYGKTYPWWTQ